VLPTVCRRSPLLVAFVLAIVACGDGPVTPPPTTAYTDAELRHFADLAFWNEGGAAEVTRRWIEPIRIRLEGGPTAVDEAVLAATLAEMTIAAREGLAVRMAAEDEVANLTIHYVARAQAEEIEPAIERWHIGYFRLWWRGDSSLARARIVLVSDEITGQTRDYIVRHEIMHAVGFMRHAPTDRGSIMYHSYSGTIRFSSLDVVVMEMLYRDDIPPGMPKAMALDLLRGIPASSRSLRSAAGGSHGPLASEGHGIAAGH